MTTFEFLDKYNSKYGSSPIKEDLKNFCRDLKSAKLGMIDSLLSTLEDRGLQQFEIEEIKKDAEILSKAVKSATERRMNWDNLMASGADKPFDILLHMVDDFGVESIANIDQQISAYAGTQIRDPALRDQFYTNIKIMLKRELANKGLNIEYSDDWSKVVSVNGNPIESSGSRRIKSSVSRKIHSSVYVYHYLPSGAIEFKEEFPSFEKAKDAALKKAGFNVVSNDENSFELQYQDGQLMKIRGVLPVNSSKRIPVTSAVRPTTVAIEKAVKGEIGDDEAAIRFFLKDKVTPASLDKAVALVLKYIPIIRKQQKKQNFATAGQIATKTNARVLPVGGDILPSKRSLSGVTYKGWTIDAAQKTPGTYYALFVGVNGPYVKAGFTDPKAALDWIEEVGDPSVYQGYVDTENIGKDIQTSVDSASFKNLSDDEKREIIDDFLAFGKVSPETLSSLSSDQRDALSGIKTEIDLKKALNQRFGALNK